MSLLSIPEHTDIPVGETFSTDLLAPSIAPRQVMALDRFNRAMKSRNAPPPFELGFRSVRSRQHCGVVSLGRETIEVLPKIEGQGRAESEVTARIRLLSMLAFSRKLPIHQAEAARLATQRFALLEVFLRLFCTQALALIRAGMLHRYERQEENLHLIRGKLIFPIHVTRNPARQDRAFCMYEEFTPNHAVNQTIKAAARRAATVTSSGSTQGMLREIVYCLDEVTDRKLTFDAYRAIPRDRSTLPYRDVLTLAGTILFGPNPDVISGDVSQVAFLFDMNKLFEEFIGRHVAQIAPALSFDASLQGPQRWLGREVVAGGGKGCFRLKPDITLSHPSGFISIIDTKWKALSSKAAIDDASESDVYQMLAYMTCYDCSTGLLLYPSALPLGEDGVLSRIELAGRRLILAAIDLSEIEQVEGRLVQLLRRVTTIERGDLAWAA